MNFLGQRLRTGKDPRSLVEYSVLRDEMAKLTHPARPDVDWQKVEQLCLNLFKLNGVELQTTAWYTIARMHNSGLNGMNEGLAILESLIIYQWAQLWPQQMHARMEILASLSRRLQQQLRTTTFSYAELILVYKAEQHLSKIGNVLQNLELKYVSQFDELSTFMRNTAIRLENLDAVESSFISPLSASTTSITNSDDASTAVSSSQSWVYVPQIEIEEPPVMAHSTTKAPNQWKGFFAGILTTLLLGSVAMLGLKQMTADPLILIQSSVLPLNEVMDKRELMELKNTHHALILQRDEMLLDLTQQRLSELASMSPYWVQKRGEQLIEQAHILWPEHPKSALLATDWQQQLQANSIPLESLNHWHQANEQLQQLADKLNSLDERRGQYMTVSQLKTAIFAIQQTLAKSSPIEESLRQFYEAEQQGNLSSAMVTKLDNQFNQLLNRYSLLIGKDVLAL